MVEGDVEGLGVVVAEVVSLRDGKGKAVSEGSEAPVREVKDWKMGREIVWAYFREGCMLCSVGC